MKLSFPFPEGAKLVRDEMSATVDFVVPESFPYFDGHFPGNPIVPAVTQIGWAKAGIEAMRGRALGGYRLSRFKFIIPIRPLDRIRVSLIEEGEKYAYRLFVNGQVCCSGLLALDLDD